MATVRNILTTDTLNNLEWSGNDKKTANIYSDFVFYPDTLPTFSEVYPTPEEFKIMYKASGGYFTSVYCNYVSNGNTRYTFSYKVNGLDAINLSIFKADGHLEINVRNSSLETPMDLNSVQFNVDFLDPRYTLTVVNGEPASIIDYASSIVNITANEAPEGQEFDKWTITDGPIEAIANIYNPSTSVHLINDDMTVTATYKATPTPPSDKSDLDFTFKEEFNYVVMLNRFCKVETKIIMNKPTDKSEDYKVSSVVVKVNGEEV